MTERKLKATIKRVTPLLEDFLSVSRYEIEAERHAGGVQRRSWLVMERGHSVGVLGYDPKRERVVLVNEMRPGALVAGDYPFTDNLAAGGIMPGETPIEAAVREMKEETGLELRSPLLVHPGAYASSGGTSEKIAIVVGIVDTRDAGGVHGNRDEHEDIAVVVLPLATFLERVRSGAITDLKTLYAGYWLAENRTRFHEVSGD
ncbi:MAG: ADP-ribose diphosphatase [Proteobacteria bacterium]|nr:MAG: ADP-ribose diphosphatase [Pseudomonadota bacterium]